MDALTRTRGLGCRWLGVCVGRKVEVVWRRGRVRVRATCQWVGCVIDDAAAAAAASWPVRSSPPWSIGWSVTADLGSRG